MRIFIFLYFLLFSSLLKGSEVSVIELHSTKSLDQLVLEQNNSENEIETNLSEESINNDESNVIDEDNQSSKQNEELVENNIIDVSEVKTNIDIEKLNFYFSNITIINSQPLYDEFIKILTESNIQNSENQEVIFLFINKLIDLGEIQKAYNLIKLLNVENDKNIVFYKTIELNYLFSTNQLVEACELKNEFNLLKFKLENYYLEKADIFCLVMEQKIDEANLLNSILIETEINIDEYFQNLINLLFNYNNDIQSVQLNLPNQYSKDLIFLYSAMQRIAELPLSEEFLDIDPNNLAIPIILSNSSNINLRLKAANKAYLNNLISVESLAALYQSVDFNSKQLNDPNNTLKEISNNELKMAYYFQLANIQIFPSSRLKVILDFWKFAESISLEKISYSLTYNIVSTIDPLAENSNNASKIATSLIYSRDFEKASKWISLADNSSESNTELENVKLLYDLYQSDNSEKILEYITNNYSNLINNKSNDINEILFVLMSSLGIEKNANFNLVFEKVMDDRKIPTMFINSEIKKNIELNNELNLFLLILLSLNEKDWFEIHPEHLRLVLTGIIKYKNSELLRDTLLDIFENNKIF